MEAALAGAPLFLRVLHQTGPRLRRGVEGPQIVKGTFLHLCVGETSSEEVFMV